MLVFLVRDSVAAGDDVDAPHEQTMTIPDGLSIEDIITLIAKSGYLASIQGGKATWSVGSKGPLAAVAQQWDAPKMLLQTSFGTNHLDLVDDRLRLHFTYYAQHDPDVVYDILHRWLHRTRHSA